MERKAPEPHEESEEKPHGTNEAEDRKAEDRGACDRAAQDPVGRARAVDPFFGCGFGRFAGCFSGVILCMFVFLLPVARVFAPETAPNPGDGADPSAKGAADEQDGDHRRKKRPKGPRDDRSGGGPGFESPDRTERGDDVDAEGRGRAPARVKDESEREKKREEQGDATGVHDDTPLRATTSMPRIARSDWKTFDGHSRTHRPHPLQRSGSISGRFPSTSVTAS